MAPETRRPLKVFLCHASGDKPPVRDLYKHLTMEGVDAWLDKEKLLPGQDWQAEIPRAVREADVVVVCLSNKSITKEGYVQKEIKFALDIAEEKPEGTIFLIPARLEDCLVPERLNRWQWVDLYEENGFVQLLRSLKLRAGTVGAVIEAVSYEDADKERERRLNQLYTEGLEAFYTEEWDRACRRFQAILSEQPNHKNAAEKLEEAQCQGHYAKLYARATEACRSENWIVAIPALEELSQKAPNYKDAAHLLRDARKREQLSELYQEAKTLHAAQKWKAVVKVFEQISVIEPNYPDADGLLLSTQKEVAELERITKLNDQYSRALQEMDAGNWHEARTLLEGIHKSQTGFLETEKLLRKAENEILKEEEQRKQNEQIEILYEQAHGLFHSRKWRNALEKLEEIKKLDEQFPDTEGIAERAQKELDREEAEAENQNRLAALYAESVRLLKEEKYQEALDKWQEVKAIDPKYPDRQGIQPASKRGLTKQAQPVSTKTRFTMPRSVWFGLGGIGIVFLLIFGIYRLRDISAPLSELTSTPDRNGQQSSGKSSTAAIPDNQPALIPELQVRVNYGHDWVESFYEAGHTAHITVTDSHGLEKGRATANTKPQEMWEGREGFQTTPENWSSEPPDIQPYDWVHVKIDNGAEAKIQIGEIGGMVNFEADSVTGTIDVSWLKEPVEVQCFDWGSGEDPPYSEKAIGYLLTDGSDPYTCSWEGEWDVRPWQDIGVGYFTPEGHWVANAFRDERWLAMWTRDVEPGFWKEGIYSYYFNWAYTSPSPNKGKSKDPLTFTVAGSRAGGKTPLYPGYVLISTWAAEPQPVWTGSSCEVVPAIHPDQLTRFVWGWVNDYSMSLEDARTHFNSIEVDVFWEGETSGTAKLTMGELLPFTDMAGRWEYRCTLTEHP